MTAVEHVGKVVVVARIDLLGECSLEYLEE